MPDTGSLGRILVFYFAPIPQIVNRGGIGRNQASTIQSNLVGYSFPHGLGESGRFSSRRLDDTSACPANNSDNVVASSRSSTPAPGTTIHNFLVLVAS